MRVLSAESVDAFFDFSGDAGVFFDDVLSDESPAVFFMVLSEVFVVLFGDSLDCFRGFSSDCAADVLRNFFTAAWRFWKKGQNCN